MLGATLMVACTGKNAADTDALPPEPGIEYGVSGAMAGVSGGYVVRVGGCNFPGDDPTGAEAQKRYYKGVYVFKVGETLPRFELIDSVKAPTAYGCGVTVPQADAVVLIGGITDGQPSGEVTMLRVSPDKKAVFEPLPPLPFGVDNAAAALIDATLYVAGGNHDGTPSAEAWSLDLAEPNAKWERLPDMPGAPRVQPVAGNCDGRFALWGGFTPKTPTDTATMQLTGLSYAPEESSWYELPAPTDRADLPLSLAGGAAANLPSGEILACGGVNTSVFLAALNHPQPDYLQHPAEWYHFNPLIMLCNTQTAQWVPVDSTEATARAGASLVAVSDSLAYLLGGEIKPRIRTPKTIVLNPAKL